MVKLMVKKLAAIDNEFAALYVFIFIKKIKTNLLPDKIRPIKRKVGLCFCNKQGFQVCAV